MGGFRTPTDGPTSNSFHYDTAAADREYAASYRKSTVANVAPTSRSVSAACVHWTREGASPAEPDYGEGTEWTSEGGQVDPDGGVRPGGGRMLS